jgi:norsolorinic acid ketoreductase
MADEIAKVTDHLDIVIANAGIAYDWVPLEKIDLEVAKEHISVDTLGTLSRFQAVLPLVRKSSSPTFVPITTEVASITSPVPYNTVSTVALSKIGVNFITQRIHIEHGKNMVLLPFQ